MENNLKINSQFASYEIALALRELGFDEECFGYYCKSVDDSYFLCIYQQEDEHSEIRIDAPLWQQCIDWFREKHKIFIEIKFADKALTEYEFVVFQTWKEYLNNIMGKIMLGDERPTTYTYEEAREKAILKSIELVKLKNCI